MDRANALASTTQTHEAAIAEAAAEALGPHAPEGASLTAGTFSHVLQALRAYLTSAAQALREADEAHNRELGDDDAARSSLESAAGEAYEVLRSFKKAAENVYGPSILGTLKLPGATPRRAQPLLAQLSALVAWLSAEDTAFPEQDGLFTPSLDKATVLAQVQPVTQALDDALQGLGRDLAESEQTLLAKHTAHSAYDEAERGLIETVEGLMKLAGMHEAASRLRP
jgi:hypothetical protein